MENLQEISVTKLEERLNYLVGITLMTNLYYVSGLFRLPSILPILATLLITAYYFIKRVNYKVLLFYTNFWIIMGFILFSVFLYIPEFVFRQSSFNPNDILRVLIYLLFVGWTVSIRTSWDAMARFFGLSSFIALLILMVLGFIEKYFPLLFAMVLPPNLVRGNLTRIGTTLIDPNTFATAMVVYFSAFYGYYSFVFKKGKYIFLLLLLFPVFLLIETSGSRQGILLFVIWLFSLGLQKNWRVTLVSVSIGVGILLMSFIVFFEQLQSYAIENPNTSVARILFQDQNKMSSISDMERSNSISAGLNFVKNNFVVFGPGSFGYKDAFEQSLIFEAPVPHNGPLYLWTQYGILTIYFLFMVYIVAKRSYKSSTLLFLIFYLIQFLLLPNSSYYFLPVFLIFCIDAEFYFKVYQLVLTNKKAIVND